ncbi:hypothetical protein GCM10009525_46590 [Streptosporangium amethystogenes subsp. fukuiense]
MAPSRFPLGSRRDWDEGTGWRLRTAERTGHEVDVLLKVHAKCIGGGAEIADRRIEDAPTA